jgi:hypothetical protein
LTLSPDGSQSPTGPRSSHSARPPSVSVVHLWQLLRLDNPGSTYTRWQEAMRLLIQRERQNVYATTRGYLTGAYLAAGHRALPEIPALAGLDIAQFATSTRVTSLVSYRRGLGLGLTPSQAADNALVQVTGSASRLALEAGRTTILDAARANDARWGRITSGNACAFCHMLASRGFVYRESTVGFDAHDHCACTGAIDFSPALAAA